MQRDLFLIAHFPLHLICKFKCPSCGEGYLTIDEKTIIKRNTAEYERFQKQQGANPEFCEERFCGLFYCSNTACSEAISCVGTTRIDEDQYEDTKGEYQCEYSTSYCPLVFDPPIKIFEPPSSSPPIVAKYLNDCFSVFWLDSSSCGNKIRSCVAALLTHFKIPRRNHKKKTPKTLHTRIELFGKTFPKYHQHMESLLAIKWLGNTASHEQINHPEIVEALEILEFVLDEIFNKRKEKIKKLSRAIIKRKGKSTVTKGLPF